MKNFFATIGASLSKSSIYENPEANKPGAAVGYLAKITLILAAVYLAFSLFVFIPGIKELKEFALGLIERYPADLEIKLVKNELTMNQPSPYMIPTTKDQKNSEYDNFIVIDTEAGLDQKTFESYNTFALITKNGYMVTDDRSTIKTQTFKDFPDFTLSKTVIEQYRSKIESIAGALTSTAIVLLALFGYILIYVWLFVSSLAMSLLGSLFAWAITRIKGYRLSFGQNYALAIYAATLMFIVKIIGLFVNLPFWVAPIAFIALLALFVSVKPKETIAQVV